MKDKVPIRSLHLHLFI